MARKTDPIVTEAERGQQRADADLMSKSVPAVRHGREDPGPDTGSPPRVSGGDGSSDGGARPTEERDDDAGRASS